MLVLNTSGSSEYKSFSSNVLYCIRRERNLHFLCDSKFGIVFHVTNNSVVSPISQEGQSERTFPIFPRFPDYICVKRERNLHFFCVTKVLCLTTPVSKHP